MTPLTNDELKELRTLGQGGEETALEWRAAVLAAHPFLLDEVEHRRRMEDEIRTSIKVSILEGSVPEALAPWLLHLAALLGGS